VLHYTRTALKKVSTSKYFKAKYEVHVTNKKEEKSTCGKNTREHEYKL